MGCAVYHLVRQGCRVRVQHGRPAALLGGARRRRAPAVRGWQPVTGLALDTHATLRTSVVLSTTPGAESYRRAFTHNIEIRSWHQAAVNTRTMPLCNETYNQRRIVRCDSRAKREDHSGGQ